MTLLQAIILGIIQGLTEFLPVSSSAHLVLTPFLLGWNIPAEQVFPFDVLVQMGTLVAVIIYFWKDLITILRGFFEGLLRKQPFGSEPARLGWYLILGSIPAGVAGLFLKDMVEQAFSSPGATALLLLGTAALLIAAEMLGRRTRSASDFNWLDALVMGLFQAVSIFPGISRSGSTISGGLFRQLDRVTAARFSFLLSIPVMLAAGGLGVLDLLEVANLASFLPVMIIGFVTAGIIGYLSIRWLLKFLTRRSLIWFAGYCILLSIISMVVYYA